MSTKLKVLGMGLLAVMVTSAFAVVNASATSNGHFTAEPVGEDHVIVKGTEGALDGHQLKFYALQNGSHATSEPNNAIECTDAKYEGTLSGSLATTATSVGVTPTYSQCRTTSHAAGTHPVHVTPAAGCKGSVFEFTSGGNGTVRVACAVTIEHPNCHITVPAGQELPGVNYTTVTEQNKHALTLHVDVKTIAGNYEGGICIFLGTSNHFFEMVGTATVWGENTNGGRVGITHTTP